MQFNTTEEILEDLAAGKMVVIVDDEDRENEGDLLMVASLTRPEDINFMVKEGRGLVCLTLTRERCKQLNLPLMISATDEEHRTNFTISIEAAEGVTTGISAYDRAHTVRTAVAPNAQPQDIEQPGHIFPLMAQPGGVLTRAGHTEAGCDLARLAGFEPAATIVEILNEDGTMARRPDLELFAEKHGLKMGSIEDLIRYRVQNEKTVERVFERDVQTDYGQFHLVAFQECAKRDVHLALIKGEITADAAVLVRVHLENELCDLLSLNEPGCGWPLRSAMQHIDAAGGGVIVILRNVGQTENVLEQLKGFESRPVVQDNSHSSPAELKTYGIGAQILSDIGVRRMRVMSAPKRFHGIAGFGLEIVEYVHD
ncbi:MULTISPECIES: bifunctional 3,4-dihydroxy-2-butanone-4-phosphate synthase/GTP cyclohydrolase II [Thiothrix]|jgi:3,4-dihydroxy 2-butanone 4-phosphate synthase/GTP cyclohydrolase II|uniref:3,4-dihydroxy-2-butanone 4-phosphate synthase n=1 Tax=Thiothrix unzii TaxID=111769 RepID=A0A975FB25_9GAMM|nr:MULTISPECIES: bifunctional 3,4-dihydroxy-2-butanone-4-phosphate synthase/GTP cyclohydrolase II [Thiothrix]MDX9988034.1 bifunctional 3,4-dihydroxy-2-butanone-4-phosphate synthase/GTP cyclohydrolase II [Thiothrix unzii]QTR54542.1 3,4-dihydroxy-2-butanone-4-phosphate synthase [Thiothrix unzii]